MLDPWQTAQVWRLADACGIAKLTESTDTLPLD